MEPTRADFWARAAHLQRYVDEPWPLAPTRRKLVMWTSRLSAKFVTLKRLQSTLRFVIAQAEEDVRCGSMAKTERNSPRAASNRSHPFDGIALVRSPWYRQERPAQKTVFRLMQRKRKKEAAPGFVVCINNSDYLASLELHKIYRIIPDEDAAHDGDLRVIDESGEDYLYSADRFIAIDVPESLERAILKAS